MKLKKSDGTYVFMSYDEQGKKIVIDIESAPFIPVKDEDVEAAKDILEGRIWITKKGEEIPYSLIKPDHLDNILSLMSENPHWRKDQYQPLLQEKRKRQQKELAKESKAGKILYG